VEIRGHVVLPETESQSVASSVHLRVARLSVPIEHRMLHTVSVFWYDRVMIVRVAAGVALFTLIFALLSPNHYRSTTELMPPDSKGSSGLAALANVASQLGGSPIGAFAGDALGMQSTGALFVGVLHSRTARENLAEQFNLRSAYGFPRLHLLSSKEDVLKELDRNTEISEDRKSGIITIAVLDTKPDRAAALARGYVDQLNTLVATLSTSAAGRQRKFLEQRLAQVKKDLDEAAQELSQFSSKNSTLDPKDQGIAMVTAAANLQGELIAAESQLQGLAQIYADNNVRVRSLRARIAELQKQLGNVSGSTPGGDPSNSQSMPFPSIRALPLLAATYSDLYRRAKIQETVYEVLTQQYEMAKVEEAKEIPTVRVLDMADVPNKKWGPHRAIEVLLGGILGLLVGCVLALLLDEWNRRDVDDPYRVFISQVAANLRRYHVYRRTEQLLKRALVPPHRLHIAHE
jgi:capsule polysaccharide export protein KpsE/RkpR